MAQVPEQVLAWLYKVLHVCRPPGVPHAMHPTHTWPPGISRCTAHLHRYRSNPRRISLPQPANRSVHLRDGRICSPAHSFRHTTRLISWHRLSIPREAMDPKALSTTAAHGVRYAGNGHDDQSGSTRRSRRQSIPPILKRLGKHVGSGERGGVPRIPATSICQGAAGHQQSPTTAVSEDYRPPISAAAVWCISGTTFVAAETTSR